MPRPRRIRRISFEPDVNYFKPAGTPLRTLKENILTRDELEAIRLIDYEKIEQKKVAKKMQISQPTLSRILSNAREKLADSLIKGKAIKIQGGKFKMVQPTGRGLGRGVGGIGRGMGRGRGRMGGFASGPSGACICPKCGYKMSHKIGKPCYEQKCPKCGSNMTRE
jgi:predicted DNA-binding protein (UPF0251 family)